MKKSSAKPTTQATLQQLAKIFDQLPAIVYWKDLAGVYLGCNDFMLQMSGTTTVVGKTDFELPWQAQAESIRKNDLAVINANQTLELHESPLLSSGHAAVMLTRKTPLNDDSGEVIGVIGISIDITPYQSVRAQLMNQAQLADLQQKKDTLEMTLENIVANMPGHVYWKDNDGTYLGCNRSQAESLGFKQGDEVIGKTDFQLPWTVNIAERFRANDLQVMTTRQPEILEEEAIINGNKAIFLSQKTPLINQRNQVVGVLGIPLDITARKHAEIELQIAKQRAELADQTKTEFLENMRHNLRTPLMGIVGFAEIIAAQNQSPELQTQVAQLSTACHTLLDLHNEILEIIKLNNDTLPSLQRKFNVVQRLQSVIELNLAAALAKKITLTFEHDAKIPRLLLGDGMRLYRIVLELVTNALTFTHQGEVTLITQLGKTTAREVIIKIIVKDSGIGIAREQQQAVYQQFKRLTPAYEGLYQGVGLGLAMVKQFVADLQGEIYVESQVGKGTTFTCVIPFKLPLLDDDDGIEEPVIKSKPKLSVKPQFKPSKAAATMTKGRILVVEDDEIAASAIMRILADLNYQIDHAKDGKAAVAMVNKQAYQLIFMDIGLPKLRGDAATKKIREQQHTMPIIALTAHVDQENQTAYLAAGMNQVLNKPLTYEKAKAIVSEFLENNTSKAVVDIALTKQLFLHDEMLATAFFNHFLATCDGVNDLIINALEAKDWEALRHFVLRVKGEAIYLGAKQLSEACGVLLSNHVIEAYDALAQKILAALAKVQQALEMHRH